MEQSLERSILKIIKIITMLSDKNLGEVLSEIILERGITLDKLSELTNIPKRYLVAMMDNDFKNMPAAPYARGYITKICSVLEINSRQAIDTYNKIGLKTSGKGDSLPQNRFALTKHYKKSWLIIIIITVIIVIFGLIFINRHIFADFFGIPFIEVNIPAREDNSPLLETNEQFFTIQGMINPQDSITINGEAAPVNEEGVFTKEVLLNPGLNTFEIRVKRPLGQETIIIREIFNITENLNVEVNNQEL